MTIPTRLCLHVSVLKGGFPLDLHVGLGTAVFRLNYGRRLYTLPL